MTDGWLKPFSVRPKLLIVDDQTSNIRILHELFRETCQVFMATSGEKAVEQCMQHLPDLILLDIVMDQVSGFDVCRQIKATPATQHIPIIFVTAKDRVEDQIAGFELGAADFITKPYHPTLVRARVRTHLMLKLQSDKLASVALIDELTGVGNRRRMDEALQLGWRQSLRDNTSMSLVMADIDYFKQYNDIYGHLAGDSCLRETAQALAAAMQRPGDLVCRYGGEEFSCILPATHHIGAIALAGKMLAGVQALHIPHEGAGPGKQVTISLGVATIVPTPDSTPAALLKLADECLYRAKAGGRARFFAAEG